MAMRAITLHLKGSTTIMAPTPFFEFDFRDYADAEQFKCFTKSAFE